MRAAMQLVYLGGLLWALAFFVLMGVLATHQACALRRRARAERPEFVEYGAGAKWR